MALWITFFALLLINFSGLSLGFTIPDEMDATNKMIEPMNLALLASEAALQRSYDLENLIENDLQVISFIAPISSPDHDIDLIFQNSVQVKRSPFSAWGGKRSQGSQFSAWGGKRSQGSQFSAWGGKRSPETIKRASFSAWGGRR